MAQAKVRPALEKVGIPPLENGDPSELGEANRLSRQEFERRNIALPEGHGAELIEGVVYRAAALRFLSHGKPHSQLNAWLAT